MALRRDAEQILTVFRNPAKLGVFSIKDGALVSSLGGVRSSLSRIHSDLDVILKHANASPGRSRQGRTSHFARAWAAGLEPLHQEFVLSAGFTAVVPCEEATL